MQGYENKILNAEMSLNVTVLYSLDDTPPFSSLKTT